MNYAHAVTIYNGVYEWSYSVSRLLFGVVLPLDDPVEEFSSDHQLHHQVETIALVKDLIKLDYVGVIQLRQNVHLRLQSYFLIFLKRISKRGYINEGDAYLSIILTATFSPVFLLTPCLTIANEPLLRLLLRVSCLPPDFILQLVVVSDLFTFVIHGHLNY